MRLLRFAVLLLVSPITNSLAQTLPARSGDYLFVTNAVDARALWVNPAGLSVVTEASIMAEFSLIRSSGDERLAQYTVGLNSRGFSVGYRRNRPLGLSAVGILRAGLGIPFRQGAVGVAFTRYGQDSISSRELDVGFAYVPGRLQFAGTMRHIGRPTVEAVELPISLVAGAQWSLTRFQLSGEVIATEERGAGESGYGFTYRTGARFAVSNGFPLVALGALDLGSNGRIRRVNIGITVGWSRQVTAVGSVVSRNNSAVLEQLSATFLATNPLTR